MKKLSKKDDAKKAAEASDQANEIKQQIDDLKKEKDDLFEKLQRVSADFANYQKRTPKQIADSVAYHKEAIVKSLLPGLDNFEHALGDIAETDNIDSVRKGVQIVYEHLLDILKSQGVEQITAIGEIFDPAIHEAILQKCDPDKEDDIILEDFQKGYRLNGRVVRPSKVVVNKLETEQDESDETTDRE